MTELQAMTVVQLRKLAKEQGVKLSAGIDKAGIVERLANAMGGEAQAATPVIAEKQEKMEMPDEVQEVKEDIEKAEAETETLQAASLAADVTSVRPAGQYGGWSPQRTEEQEGYRPVYRQAWQARTAAQRNAPPARPAWQQPQRQGGTANRFGPAPAVKPAAPEPVAPPRESPRMPTYNEPVQQRPVAPETAPKLDGYRLGYRAAPQRTAYPGRDGGGYQQGGYRQSGPGYRQNNYRGNSYGGGYQQSNYPVQGSEMHYNNSMYRMNRDPQFVEQAENGQLPELLKVQEGEPAGGVLEILPDGYGFLRGNTLLPGKKDIYVSVAQIRRFDLRTGDMVEGKARTQRESDKFAALLVVEKVNGEEAKENPERPSFDQLVPIYPNRRIALESEKTESSMVIRLVDLIAPIGFGQRAMIVTPPHSEGLMILRDISRAIKRNDKDAEVLMLLIDVAPEDVTELKETADAEVFASTFADAPEMQTRVSETMLERAERLVEDGRNVVILLDSLTKLTRAYQATMTQGGRPMNNTVIPTALVRPKRFFGAARNTREGGSLTVVATINVETGSRVDDIIFEEFKGTANMELFLLSPQQGDPIQPMIDLQRSGTKKDDMLLSDERKESLRAIRKVLGSTTNGEAVVQLIEMMKKTKCNEDLMNRLKDWVALWEKSGYLKR